MIETALHTTARSLVMVLGLLPVLLLLPGTASADGHGERTASPSDAACYLISPKDGETLNSPIPIRFGLRGMGVAPAGVAKTNSGHHHLIIDAELPELQQPIPATENYRHFGGGQTEVSLELSPGTHSLQLILGDALHIPHDPPVISEKIVIHVR